MSLFLVTKAGRTRLPMPPRGAKDVATDATCACGKPLRVRGAARHPGEDDRAWEAEAHAVCCGRVVGVLRLESETIFGVLEDDAVLNGRPRVYDGTSP